LLVHGRTWSALPDFDLQVPGENRSLMDALVAEGYSAFAVDLRGYGRSPRDDSGWMSPDKAAADVNAVLSWIDSQFHAPAKPVLLGWSMGATVSQLAVQSRPDLVSALVLFGYWFDSAAPIPLAPEPVEPPRRATTAENAASDFIAPGVITRKAIDAYVKACLAADPIRVDWRRLDQFNALDAAKVTVPTLLLQGEHDPLANTDAHARVFTHLGTAERRWIVIAGGDHAALLEDTQPEFVASVVEFIERPRPD
jgi:pimeloyl-ACP methyl ester carboxylesterase